MTEQKILKGQLAWNKYGCYFTPDSSEERPVNRRIRQGEVHEPETIQFIRDHCAGGDVIHAGTYFGDFLPGISQALAETSLIWAFEPNRENFRCTLLTIIINDLQNVILKNTGLGSGSSKGTLLVRSPNGKALGGASHFTGTAEPDSCESADLLAIDSYLPQDRQVSVIHLDVEGFEKEALTGALDTIRRCHPVLILEDNQHVSSSRWFQDHILSIGYVFKKKVHGNFIFLHDL